MQQIKHILVVDDDARLRDLLSQYLRDHDYVVTCASDANDARAKMQAFLYDMMIVDVMMPGETGKAFLQSLPNDAPPALMLTALGESDDRIDGLESGADDYVVKPFEPKELLLRIQNILKRTMPAQEAPAKLAFGPFTFDVQTHQLLQEGEPVYLTSSELQCMDALAEHAGEPVSREQLVECTSSELKRTNERSVDVMINRLRKKIEPEPARPVYIQTVRHAGYVLHAQRQA